MTSLISRLLVVALAAATFLLSACAAPGKPVVRQEGDFALIEIQLQG